MTRSFSILSECQRFGVRGETAGKHGGDLALAPLL